MFKKLFEKLIFQLIIAIILGVLLGKLANAPVISVVNAVKGILSQLINFCVPLIILGFVTPAIISLKENAGKVLTLTLIICYLSSIGAAFLSTFAGYSIIPHLNIISDLSNTTALPPAVFKLDINPIIPVITALVSSIMFGIAALKTEAPAFSKFFRELNQIVLFIAEKFVVRILPIFILSTFATLTYEGNIINNFPVFIKVIIIVMIGHFIWMTFMYSLAGGISRTNPLKVVRNYFPAYMTAVGTMSSAATLSVALQCASKAPTLDPKIRDFAIPLCSNTHLCGSVLTETFFVMTVSKILYGQMPSLVSMVTFCLLLGIFAVAAPGVPGGTVVASLGLITSVLGFDDAGTALMLSIFALQDSFGTACNVTTDGAIALMVTGFMKKVPGQNGNPPLKITPEA